MKIKRGQIFEHYKNHRLYKVNDFAINEKDGKEIHKHLFAFPAYGNKGTQIFTDAIYRLPGVENEENYNDIKKANDGKGFGWTYIKITDIDVPDGATVRYGVSTDKEFTGEKCTAKWFSACDFNFTKQD